MAALGQNNRVFNTPANGPNLDAFGRQRVSQNHILLSGQLQYADNPLIWDTLLVSGGTTSYLVDKSSMRMTVTSTTGSRVVRQTKRYWLYRSGQTQLCRATFADGDPIAFLRKRVGYNDDNDGIFFEVNGTVDLAWTIRTSTSGSAAVFERVAQANWNGDKLDGTGPSGLTLDVSKVQHVVMDMQWLGAGPVRVGFVVGGRLIHAHTFETENVIIGGPYMKTASLPVRYEIENLAGGAGGTFQQMCPTVIREGGEEDEGILKAVSSPLSGATRLNATTTVRSAIAIQLRASHIRAFLRPVSVSIANFGSGGEDVGWALVLNPTLGGAPTYIDEGASLTAAKVLLQQQTYTSGTGHEIAAGLVGGGRNNDPTPIASKAFESLLGVASNIAGDPDTLALVVESATGTPEIRATVTVLELF